MGIECYPEVCYSMSDSMETEKEVEETLVAGEMYRRYRLEGHVSVTQTLTHAVIRSV